MNHLSIKSVNTPAEAPKYGPEYKAVTLDEALIVETKGTQEGLATIDLVLTDKDGNKYVGMVTGRILLGLASALRGANQRNFGVSEP